MTQELSAPGLAQTPRVASQEGIIVLLLDALQKLADTGEVDAACRIAGKACASSAKHPREPNSASTPCCIVWRAGSGQSTGGITMHEVHILA